MGVGKQRVFGVVLVVIGIVFILNGIGGMTGFVVFEDVLGGIGKEWSFVVGLVLVVGGIFTLVSKQHLADLVKYSTRQEARNAVNKQRMINEYRFQEATGLSSDDPRAWTTFYHAYPRNREFKQGRIDERLAGDGFYLAENPREAIDVVGGMNALELRDISVIRVKIAKNVTKGILKASGDYSIIPKKRIKNANRLIEKGFIQLEEM